MYKKGQKMVQNKSTKSVQSILQLPYAEMPERGIRKDTCEFFNVRMGLSEETREPTAYYFPYYDQKGTLTGWKVRDLTKSKYDDFHFTTIGKVGVECKLFGQQQIKDSNSKTVYFFEGEGDTLAAFQVLKDSLKGTKFENTLVPCTVSLSCGTSNAVEAVFHNLQWLTKRETICLAFDNDEANDKEKAKGIKRGREATEDVAASLMTDNINVIEWGEGMKDPCDYVQEGRNKELLNLLLKKGKKFQAEKIVTGTDIGYEEFIRKGEIGIYVDTFPKLMDKIKGFRKRELTVVTGPSGIGKSVMVSEIMYCLAEKDQRLGAIFLEEETHETMKRMGARNLKVKYNDFKTDPLKFATDEQLRESFEWLNENQRFVYLDHFGSLPIEELINKLKALTYLSKVDFIILDHLSMTVSGLNENDERKLLDKTMTELAAFCASTDVGVIVVSHINRTIVDEYKKRNADNPEPYWIEVKKEMLRGTAGIEQMSWIIIAVEPEIMPDRSRGRVRWSVLKNRPHGWLGVADVVKMDDKTGLFYDADDLEDY